MDDKLSVAIVAIVAILHEHSEQLRKLSTVLSADLRELRLALSAQDGAADTEELGLLLGLAELNHSLFTATDIFYQRLQAFLQRGNIGNGSDVVN
jgi:hypothetical protein